MPQLYPRPAISSQPGEIWRISRSHQTPVPLDTTLYSEPAQQFLSGQSPDRYVMIVREPSELDDSTVWVMLLSAETHLTSPVDRPLEIQNAGVVQSVLAETWHLVQMLVDQLEHPIEYRLSRQQYDQLLDLSDRDFHRSPEIQAFHEHEQAWSDVLTVPLAVYQSRVQQVKQIVEAALELERDLALPLPAPVSVQRWFARQFEARWQACTAQDLATWMPPIAVARSCEPPAPDAIAELISQLLQAPAPQQQQAAKRLGQIANPDPNVISALVTLLHQTQDDETLWAAAEALWKLDPTHSAAGVRRVRRIDWGMHLAGQAVALVVAIVQKSNQEIGVFLQVYPTETAQYLPSDLKLMVMDESGEVQRELSARQSDLCLQLKLSGTSGERFSVCLQRGTARITEEFML